MLDQFIFKSNKSVPMNIILYFISLYKPSRIKRQVDGLLNQNVVIRNLINNFKLLNTIFSGMILYFDFCEDY